MNDLFGKIMATVDMVGTDLPAYKALFNSVVLTMSESDQVKLKASYEDALKRADVAHDRAQSL